MNEHSRAKYPMQLAGASVVLLSKETERRFRTMIETETHRCSICQLTYTGFGNNAQPVNDGRCCDTCNALVVIPARQQRMKEAEA
jgi:hypothetical protein